MDPESFSSPFYTVLKAGVVHLLYKIPQTSSLKVALLGSQWQRIGCVKMASVC